MWALSSNNPREALSSPWFTPNFPLPLFWIPWFLITLFLTYVMDLDIKLGWLLISIFSLPLCSHKNNPEATQH